jgi:peptidoglycan/LPS O-acetylase OafA/YrhL
MSANARAAALLRSVRSAWAGAPKTTTRHGDDAAVLSLTRSRGTLAENYSGRDNGIGLLRLLLAIGVVLSHAKPLGFAQKDLGYYLFSKQTNVGTLSVYGFFVLSGLLITRSARRTSIGRYAWHRVLRIMPALWVCLLVTALVVGPLVALREHGDLDGYWNGPAGPVQYLTANWWTGIRQYGIHDLLVETTPWGRAGNGSVFDGALWSLAYEMSCYVMIGILAFTAVLNRARRFVLVLALGLYAVILRDYWTLKSTTAGPLSAHYDNVGLPLIGGLDLRWVVYLGFLFLVGAGVELYRERIPIHDGLGLAAAAVFLLTLKFGGFFLIGFPAYAYLLIWLAIRLPRRVHWVGRKNDYSYGIYIYGFLGQQIFASLGWSRWGYLPFVAMSLAAAFAAAYASWHLVEKHALSLKGWSPRRRSRRPHPNPAGDEAGSDAQDSAVPAGESAQTPTPPAPAGPPAPEASTLPAGSKA